MFFGPWWDDDQALSFFGRPLPQRASADGSPPAVGAADGDAVPDEQLAQAGQLDPNSRFAAFFAANYPYAARIGVKYAVDPTLLLGLAALESNYGTSNLAKRRNNPLGMRPDRRPHDCQRPAPSSGLARKPGHQDTAPAP